MTGRGVKLSEEHGSIYLRATAKLGVMKGHNFINEGGNLNELESYESYDHRCNSRELRKQTRRQRHV